MNRHSQSRLSRLATVAALASASALLLLGTPARAADTTPAATPAADTLAPARSLIAAGKWRDAIEALRSVNDTSSADWNNLMGYSHRKASTPDFAAAERYYDAALRIDSKHRGALEYSGELYLMMGDLARAEARLEALNRTCTFGCDELKQLRTAVAAFKANGNKYAAKP
jgi:tetratricopeptide (TPR) repeat protein